MKSIPFFIIAFTIVSLEAFSESTNEAFSERLKQPALSPQVVLDTAQMEVIYVHITEDPILNDRRVDYEMLTIGDNFNHYGGYGDYQLDSISRVDPDFNCAPTFEDFRTLRRELEPITLQMTTDRQASEMNYYGKIFINYYRYSEPIPEIEWILDDETEEVMGYECRKATATWRGRDWTAWYSEIPVDAGPWKFQGLPGLILKLEDSKGEHMFEAVGTKNEVFPFGYRQGLYCKTTREKYEEGLKDYKLNAGKMMLESGMVQPTSDSEMEFLKNRRMFYNPIELE